MPFAHFPPELACHTRAPWGSSQDSEPHGPHMPHCHACHQPQQRPTVVRPHSSVLSTRPGLGTREGRALGRALLCEFLESHRPAGSYLLASPLVWTLPTKGPLACVQLFYRLLLK